MSETTVLVCEDEFIIRTALSEELRGAGYRVLEADNAAAAQEIFLSGEKIDLLVTDIVMPGSLDGIDLGKWVKEAYPTLPVVVVTGWHKHRERCAAMFDDILMKPYSFSDLAGRLSRLIGLGPTARP